ncbi:MAG: hypothetical protein C6I05_00820 [Epsilonproteobacteria bacterium]|nr:hypothetical protein [Campylobacterota bacterium]
MLPEVDGTTPSEITIEGYYAALNGDKRCNVYFIRGMAIGTQNDRNGSDLVDFTIYDDGAVVASTQIAIPVGELKEFNITLTYESEGSEKAPGVAVESQDLQIYIDPYIPEENSSICDYYKEEIAIRSHIERNCRVINRYGVECCKRLGRGLEKGY